MKKSIGLLSALVVTTTFIVNCQKAPEKRRVRPSGGSGTQSDVIEKAKTTKECSAELKTSFDAFAVTYKAATAKAVNDQMSKEEIEQIKSDLNKSMVKCTELLPALEALGESQNFGCISKGAVESENKIISKETLKKSCYYVGQVLEKQHGAVNNVMVVAQKEEEKSKADAEKIKTDLLGNELLMSKHASSLIVKNNINGGKFLANGVIESSTESLTKAKAASQTVCTFIGKVEVDFKEGVEATLKIVSTQKAEKHELESLDSEFAGKATLIATEVSQDEIKNESISLLCLNLDAEKLTVDKIKAALGSDITTAPTKVSTEVTDSSSETALVQAAPAVSEKASSGTALTAGLAAAQPAGSPQDQFLASATTTLQAQKAAEKQEKQEKEEAEQKAKEAKELADKKAKEEADKKAQQQAAVVTTGATPAASGASATAAAKVETEDQVDVEGLKVMADRFESEAKEAEANVAKLEADKAKAEDIQEAKAVAQKRRQSADEAKAKYEAAVKKAALPETKTT